ncbi:MAG: hypothetical protein KAR19_18990, partial [Bacteroidales bacterium]|nr:hypothetical protein [Bacteroidales bacterium]
MKYIKLALFLFSISYYLSAQDTVIYNQSVTLDTVFSSYDNVEVYAHNSISLNAGFTFSSNGNGAFTANADPWNVEEPDETLPPGTKIDSAGILDGSYVVGSIRGQHGVSPTGAATYTIPIEVPVGNKGMVPQLSVGYSSSAGNGIMGRGWNLGGISSITATGKVRYYDNESSSISATDEDCRVVWDGQRLVVEGDSGLNAKSYRTEIASNTQITRGGSGSSMYFIVKTPDGRTLEYGNTSDSRLKLDDNTQWKWMLNKVYDRNGNAILYSYDKDEGIGKILLSEIEYGGITSSSPVNTISFHYTTREDISYGYIHDDLILNEQLLDSISIESNNTYLGSFGFHYDNSLDESLLNEIIQYDKDNYRFNATTVDWEAPDFDIDQTTESISLNSGSNSLKFSGDFTGDGISDLVIVSLNNYTYSIYEGSSSGLSSSPSESGNLPRSYLYEKWNNLRGMFLLDCNYSGPTIPTSISPADIENVSAGDYDGDGIMELFVEVLEWESLVPYINDNCDFFNEIDYIQNICQDSSGYKNPSQIPLDYSICRFINFDISTSNSAERVRGLKYGTNIDLPIRMYFCPDILGYGYSPFCIDRKVQYIDDSYSKLTSVIGTELDPEWMELNGDGHYDYIQDSSTFFHLMLYEPENDSFALETTVNDVFLGSIDLNGDGISGYVALGDEEFEQVSVSLSTLWEEYCDSIGGCTMGDGTQWYNFLGIYGLEDDYDDFLENSCSGNNNDECWANYRSYTYVDVPESIGHELYIDHLSGRDYRLSLGYYDNTVTKAFASDIDANGRNELLLLTEDTLISIFYKFEPEYIGDSISYDYLVKECGYRFGEDLLEGDFNGDGIIDLVSEDTNKQICFVTSGKPGKLISSITNGMGIESRFSYKALTDASVYTSESDASFPVIDLTAPWFVVSSVSSDNGVADSSYVEYDYEGAKIHLQGKGFLGFMETTIENDLQNTSQISTSDYDTRFFHTYPVTSLLESGTDSVQRSTYYISIDSIDIHKFRVETDSVKVKNILAGTTTTITYQYNNDGLVSNKMTDVDGEATITEEFVYASAGWHVSASPQYVTKTYTRNGSSETDSTYYAYESTSGNPTRKIDFYETDRELITTYSNYDSFGNPRKIATSGKRGATLSVDSIETTLAYSDDGRFLLSKTGPLDHKTTYEYDYSTGLLESQKGSNRKATNFEYGPFGGKKKTIHPDLIEKGSALLWAVDHTDAPAGALFYGWANTSGSTPVLAFYDERGRILRSVATGFNDDAIYVDTEYDTKGRVSRKSMPYFSSDDTIWSTITYDSYGRVLTETSPDTSVTTYDYEYLETTVTTVKGSDTQEVRKKVNSLSETIESEDNLENIVHNTYLPDGKLDSTYTSNHSTTSTKFTYDAQGNRTSITDPDAGTITSLYDAFGQLLRQINAKDDTTTYLYDAVGRTTRLTDARGDIFYSYITDTTSAAFGQVDSVYNSDHSLQELFTYDSDLGRLLTETRTGVNKTFTNTYTYDWFGRPMTRTYPSDFEIEYMYTSNGDLDQVRGNGLTLWRCSDVNALGQITSYSQGGNSTSVTYNMHGELNSVTTGTLMDMKYGFDDMGNLSSREDVNTLQKELFEYDNLSRLTSIDYYLDGSHVSSADLTMGYDNCGNITSKTGVSASINYGEDEGPHALTSIDNPDTLYYPPPQRITYNCFNKVSLISDTLSGGIPLELDFIYGLGNQRIKTIQTRNSSVERVKYFDVDYEEDSTSSGLKKYHYIHGGNGLTAIFVMEGSGNDTMYYVLSDHLGSLTTIVNATTSEVKNYSFNAWGTPRDTANWTERYTGDLFAGRGFTGHEHLTEFNLINMNGRVYDPILGRFLSPDPFVQLPGYANSFNRYAYVLNNPLKYTDPSGYQTYIGTSTMMYSNHCRPRPEARDRFDQAPNVPTQFGGGGGSTSQFDADLNHGTYFNLRTGQTYKVHYDFLAGTSYYLKIYSLGNWVDENNNVHEGFGYRRVYLSNDPAS